MVIYNVITYTQDICIYNPQRESIVNGLCRTALWIKEQSQVSQQNFKHWTECEISLYFYVQMGKLIVCRNKKIHEFYILKGGQHNPQ